MPKTGRSLVGMAAGFIMEWWPVFDRNGGPASRRNPQPRHRGDAALIAHQDLRIRKLQRALHDQSSERSARLHDQMELTLEELESTATYRRTGRGPDHRDDAYMRNDRRIIIFPSTCRANAWSSRRRPLAIAAAVIGCASWVRI